MKGSWRGGRGAGGEGERIGLGCGGGRVGGVAELAQAVGQPDMEGEEASGGDEGEDEAAIPKPVGIGAVFDDKAGEERSEAEGQSPGEAKGGHVAAAHGGRGQAGDDGLAGGGDEHFADSEDGHGKGEEEEASAEAEHAEANGVEDAAGSDDEHGREGRQATGNPELEEHDHGGVHTQENGVALIGDAAEIAQEYGQGAVHLGIDEDGEAAHDDESQVGAVAEDAQVASQALGNSLLGLAFGGGGASLGEDEEDDGGSDVAANSVGDEEGEIGLGGEQAANDRANGDSNIDDDAPDAEAFGVAHFGQDICDDGLLGGLADIGEDAGDGGECVEEGQTIGEAHAEGSSSAHDETKDEDTPAAEFVRQGATDEAADNAGDRKNGEENAGFDHADFKAGGDVEREKGEEQGTTEPVNEGGGHKRPEGGWELGVGGAQAGEHGASIREGG